MSDKQGHSFHVSEPYSQTDSYITDPNRGQCSPSSPNRCTVLHSGVGRRTNMQTDSCITAFVTHSIPTVNGLLDCSLHVLSPSFRLCESPLLSLRHLPTNPSPFPCDFGSRTRGTLTQKPAFWACEVLF